MNKPVVATSELTPELREQFNKMRDNVLIAIVKRGGGNLLLPVSEVDDAGDEFLTMTIDEDKVAFVFSVRKKQ